MNRHALPHSAAQAANILDAIDTLNGHPAPPARIAGTWHPAIPRSWDGNGPVPPGYTGGETTHAHPDDPTQLRVVITEQTQAHLLDETARARCTAPQLALLDALATIDTVPPDWIPTPEEP